MLITYNSYIVEWEITTSSYVTVILCLLECVYVHIIF